MRWLSWLISAEVRRLRGELALRRQTVIAQRTAIRQQRHAIDTLTAVNARLHARAEDAERRLTETRRYRPAQAGRTNIGTPIVLWMHSCGVAESFGADWRPEDGGCDACESGSPDAADWQPLYVMDGEQP